jgi:hypothetical protein
MYEHGYGKEINKDGRHVGLDFYDLLIEAIIVDNSREGGSAIWT